MAQFGISADSYWTSDSTHMTRISPSPVDPTGAIKQSIIDLPGSIVSSTTKVTLKKQTTDGNNTFATVLVSTTLRIRLQTTGDEWTSGFSEPMTLQIGKDQAVASAKYISSADTSTSDPAAREAETAARAAGPASTPTADSRNTSSGVDTGTGLVTNTKGVERSANASVAKAGAQSVPASPAAKVAFNEYQAALYADHWTATDQMNPAYNTYDATNCANFASQTLVAGGLPQVGYWNVSDGTNWFAHGFLGYSSHTFINSQQLNAYLYLQAGFPGMNSIWVPATPTTSLPTGRTAPTATSTTP